MVRPLRIRGAYIWDGHKTSQRDLCTDGDRIVAAPVTGAQVIDLDGYNIFPGLINAHDHLELNHYPRSKFRERYDNARQWHDDMNVRLNEEPYKSLRAYPLWDKLFIGGLKNLLCGATTVAHHNPPHKDLWRKDFPVRVLKQYGWSHSFYLSTDEEIVQSYRSTPKDWPWFIHLAEGTDDVAASEYQRLKALGCVGKNTVIVHGVGMTENDIVDAAQRVRGLVWCESTNHYLLWQIPNIRKWILEHGHVAIGSDSKLTAQRDLSIELFRIMNVGLTRFEFLIEASTTGASKILGLSDLGHLNAGALADWIVYPNKCWMHDRSGNQVMWLCFAASPSLVVKGGIPQIGNPDLMAKFTDIKTVAAILDDIPKAIHNNLAKRIHANAIKESGLAVEALPKRKLFLFK